MNFWVRLLLTAIAFGLSFPVYAAPIADEPFDQLYRDPFIHGSAEENDARSIAVSKDGAVWVASAGGVRRIEKGRFVEPEGTKLGGPALKVEADKDGAVWIGAWNGVYVAKGNKVEKVGSIEGPITAVCTDEGRVLVGSPAGVFESKDGQWKKLGGQWATSIRDIAVAMGDVFVGTDIGLYRFNGRISQIVTLPNEITSSSIRSLVSLPGKFNRRETPQSVWVGTNAGSDVLELNEGGWSRELWVDETGLHLANLTSVEARSALPAKDVRAIVFGVSLMSRSDEYREIMATRLGVLEARFSLKSVAWKLLHSLRWLPSDDVRDVAIGPGKTIWAATAAGVSAIRRKKMTLAEKAKHYEAIVRARHVRPPGLVEKCLLKTPGDLSSWQPTDTDNDGEYTGTYLVAEAYRWAVTKDPEAKKNAQEAFAAMEFLQTVTGTKGFIARTVIPADWKTMADPNRTYTPQEKARMLAEDPREKFVENRWRLSADGKWRWKGDTSSDEVIGHFYAWGVYYDLVAEGEEKKRVAELCRRVMDFIIEGGYVFRDIDGQATRWGVWSPEKLNDDPNWRPERGVNSVEILSFLTTTKHMTGDEKYEPHIERLLTEHKYRENILEPRPSDVGQYTHIDDELLPMAYRALLTYEKNGSRRELYAKSARAWFATVREETSPYYNFEYASLMKESGEAVRQEECVQLLRDVPLDMIHWTVDNTRREDVRLARRPVASDVQTDRLLPASERALCKWDSNPYRAEGGDGGRTETCPAYWLWPYWLGRYHGLIGEDEAGSRE